MSAGEVSQESLSDLAGMIEPIPDGIDLSTAMIASIEPKKLAEAVSATIEGYRAELKSGGLRSRMLELGYDHRLRSSESQAVRKAAKIFLDKALMDQQAATDRYNEIASEFYLAYRVSEQKRLLTKPTKWLTAAIFSLGLGIGTASVFVAAQKSSNQATLQLDKSYNGSHLNDAKSTLASSGLDRGQIELDMVFEALALVGGAGFGLAASEVLSGRVARKKAQAIIGKARPKPRHLRVVD